MSNLLEIACFNLRSAIIAQEAGADRIELCQDYKVGGITPSLEVLSEARKKISIPLYVIIRPREGDFVYSQQELNEMIKYIQWCKDLKMDGLVFGCLTSHHTIDIPACKKLIEQAYPLALTFHRAVDSCHNLVEALQNISDLGFNRVLSSGGKSSALEGKEDLARLNQQFGTKLIVMPGGGIRSENLLPIKQTSKCQEFHSAAIIHQAELCDEEEVKKLKNILCNSI